MNTLSDIPNAFAETLKECIEEGPITQRELGKRLGISEQLLNDMKRGRRRCTAEHDLRLSRYFKTSQGFWLRLQTAHDIRQANATHGKTIEREVTPAA